MGVFAVLLTFGFIGSVLAMGAAIERFGWRGAWQDLALAVLALAPVFWICVRSTPQSVGAAPDDPPALDRAAATRFQFTLREALATPAFWIVLAGASAFNLVWSGVTLFNESMLAEHGLDKEFAVQIMAILTGVGLLANVVGGALASTQRVVKLLGVGLLTLAAGLGLLPLIGGATGARLYAALIGLSGGLVTVVFFAAWGHLFGQSQLGRIQGAAQLATVLASALGPVVMAQGAARAGSYSPVFALLAALIALLAGAAFLTPIPSAPPLADLVSPAAL